MLGSENVILRETNPESGRERGFGSKLRRCHPCEALRHMRDKQMHCRHMPFNMCEDMCAAADGDQLRGTGAPVRNIVDRLLCLAFAAEMRQLPESCQQTGIRTLLHGNAVAAL